MHLNHNFRESGLIQQQLRYNVYFELDLQKNSTANATATFAANFDNGGTSQLARTPHLQG